MLRGVCKKRAKIQKKMQLCKKKCEFLHFFGDYRIQTTLRTALTDYCDHGKNSRSGMKELYESDAKRFEACRFQAFCLEPVCYALNRARSKGRLKVGIE